MQGMELISVPPVVKFIICAVIFAALLVVYWWQPDQEKEEDPKKENPNCVELDPRVLAGPSSLLDPSLEDKPRSTQHVTLELLDDYAKELKKQHIRSFDEV
ncbi:MAG: hypothetical protein RBU29_13790 [bacterium]|jgi:hypothetical protein|nr:hypothetical protein [bacterium]